MSQPSPVEYAPTPDGWVAYRTAGSGQPDLVLVSDWFSHASMLWAIDSPFLPVLDRMASFSRLITFDKRGVDSTKLTFAADFGRRLDYYTGFVFEVHDPKRHDGRQIVGGGRYDQLIALIGHGQAIPAVGFSVWLDRIGGRK